MQPSYLLSIKYTFPSFPQNKYHLIGTFLIIRWQICSIRRIACWVDSIYSCSEFVASHATFPTHQGEFNTFVVDFLYVCVWFTQDYLTYDADFNFMQLFISCLHSLYWNSQVVHCFVLGGWEVDYCICFLRQPEGKISQPMFWKRTILDLQKQPIRQASEKSLIFPSPFLEIRRSHKLNWWHKDILSIYWCVFPSLVQLSLVHHKIKIGFSNCCDALLATE